MASGVAHCESQEDLPKPEDAMEERRLLSLQELARYLGVPASTCYQWRHKGAGPCGIRVGRYVRYRPEDVEAWLDKQADPRPAA